MLNLRKITKLSCASRSGQFTTSSLCFSTSSNHESGNSDYSHSSNTSSSGKWFLLVFPLGGIALGTWQIQRKKWKLGLIRKLEERTTRDPQQFPHDLSKLKDLEYCPLIVKGKFDHSKEFLIHPRSFIDKNAKQAIDAGSMISVQKNIGAQVIVPFHLENSDLTILINRGFVPREKMKLKYRLEGQTDATVEVTGLLRHTEKRPPLSPRNVPEKNHWVYKDLDEMSAMTGASPILLDAIYDDTASPVAPIGGQTRVTMRDEHISYVITWYGLALVTGIMWYRRFILKI